MTSLIMTDYRLLVMSSMLILRVFLSRRDMKDICSFLSSNIPCIIFCRSIKPEPKIIELAVKYQIPLLMTDKATSSFTAEVIRWLKVQLAPCIVIHGVFS